VAIIQRKRLKKIDDHFFRNSMDHSRNNFKFFGFFCFWVLAGSSRKWPHSVMIVKGFLVPDFAAGCVWSM